MQICSHKFLASLALTVALTGSLANAQGLPTIPGTNGQGAGAQSLGARAKEALSNVKLARGNISKKDYASAKNNISSARDNLKGLSSSSGLSQAEGMAGAKSPVSQVDKQLGGAEQALAKNQPKAADNLLGKAEGLLQSLG